jgi:hypothetical protein
MYDPNIFTAEPVNYQFNVTANDQIRDVYVDGRRYDVPNDNIWYWSGQLRLNYMPSVIAVAGSNCYDPWIGILGSDNAGRVTDGRYRRYYQKPPPRSSSSPS